MQKYLIALAVLSMVCAIIAQKPVPCTTPPQWEGRVFDYDEKEQFTRRAHITYDAIYQRERIFEEQILGTDQEFYDTLYLHNIQTEYRYNLKAKNCTRIPITRPWRNFGIPTNASSFGESYIGSSAVPNANLLTTIWGGNFTDPQGNKVTYFGVWTLEGCLPVSAIFTTDQYGSYHSNFFDITPGISDPNAFIPRPECLQ